jgi:hypothetical protein
MIKADTPPEPDQLLREFLVWCRSWMRPLTGSRPALDRAERYHLSTGVTWVSYAGPLSDPGTCPFSGKLVLSR